MKKERAVTNENWEEGVIFIKKTIRSYTLTIVFKVESNN